jgi:hypothetical protein
MDTYAKKQKHTLADGGELACVLSAPHSDRLPKMSDFYKRVIDNCLLFCEKKLSATLPVKSHSYRYRLCCTATEKEGEVSVTLAATLTDRSLMSCVFSHRETHLWREDMLMRHSGRKSQH